MRYLLTVPLVKKFAWMCTINVSNPFNHRGRANQFGINGAGTIVPVTLTGGNGTPARDDYQPVIGNPYQIWKETGTVNGQYISRQGARSFSVETGLRF